MRPRIKASFIRIFKKVEIHEMKNFKSCIAFLVLSASLLYGDIISYTNQVDVANGEDTVLSLRKFDSALGTLSAINLEFRLILGDMSTEFDNDNASIKNVQADFASYLTSFSMTTRWGSAGSILDNLYVISSDSFELLATTGDATSGFNQTGLADYYNWGFSGLNDSFSDAVNSDYFTDYYGTGTFDATINLANEFSHSPTFKVFRNETLTDSQMTAVVTYEYAVPEPAAMGLITLGGLITLVVSRFRRR